MGGCCGDDSSDDRVSERISEDPEEEQLLKYGERLKYDRSFKGPLQKRSCTDVFCLLIFIIFLAAWGYIGSYAIRNGDLNKLLVPTDSLNRKCGVDGPVVDKPYLFFFNLEKCIDPFVPITGCPTPQVCVAKCPTQTFVWDTMKNTLSLEQLKERLICQSEFDKNKITDVTQADLAISENRCARWYVQSTPLSKRCVPSDTEGMNRLVQEIKLPPEIATLTERMLGADLNGVGEKIVEDIISSWVVIFLALVVTMIVSLIFIALMRWVATPIVWLSILGVLAGLGFGVYYSVTQYKYWKATPTVPHHSLNLSSSVKNIFQQHNTWLYASIALGISFVVIFLLVIVLRSRIRIAIAIVKEGSKAVSCVVSTVFFPILPWFLYICTITLAVGIGLYLASIGEPTFKVIQPQQTTEKCDCEGPAINYTLGAQCDPGVFQNNCFKRNVPNALLSSFFNQKVPCVDTGCYFEKIGNPTIVSYFQAYNVVGFLWLSFFISALGDMVLAATFATWYWTFHKSDVPYFVLTKAFFRTIRYHLGTLALGAFILTICRIIRIILEYIDQKCKKFDNSVTRAIMCCLKCFFWCLENFLRFINRNAYIMCAIHGKNFCVSAKDSFNLLMRNFLRVIAIDKVTDFLFFLSKLLLTGAAGVGTYYYLISTPTVNHLNYTAVPITIVVIATFLITSVFFGVYSMAVDTLFLCFLEDCERNDGSEEKPYFMSKQLMRILHKSNKMPK